MQLPASAFEIACITRAGLASRMRTTSVVQNKPVLIAPSVRTPSSEHERANKCCGMQSISLGLREAPRVQSVAAKLTASRRRTANFKQSGVQTDSARSVALVIMKRAHHSTSKVIQLRNCSPKTSKLGNSAISPFYRLKDITGPKP